MKQWLKGWWHVKHRFSHDDPNYRRLQLIQTILVIMQVYFIAIAAMNIWVFDLPDMAVVDFVAFILATAILLYLRASLNIDVVAWLIIVIVAALLIVFMHMAEGRNYALYWLTLLPPVAFFLVGRNRGLVVSVAFFGYCFAFIWHQSPQWLPAVFKPESLSNMVLATTLLILLFRHFEVTRAEAYKALTEKNALLEKLSITDSLTGLYNRARLDHELTRELTRSSRDKSSFSVILLDLDHFKRVNDNYGHLTGDQILIEFSLLLQQTIRTNDIVGRWGGEEFLILCPATDQQGTIELANKIRLQLTQHRFSTDQLEQTASFGVSELQANDNKDELIRRADEAIYRAKAAGRDCVAS